MESWPEPCFKAYDIRGLANGDGSGELTPEFAYRLGRALATYLECESYAVGRDIRNSSPALASQLMAGLADGGVKGLDLRIVSTGCVYHGCWTLPVNGGVMVTASHLPKPTHNGFKMCRGTLPCASNGVKAQGKQTLWETVVFAVLSNLLRPIHQGTIVVLTGDAAEPCSSLFGAHQGHVSTAARSKARGDTEVDVLGEFVLSPERFEFVLRHGQVALVNAAATTAVADVDRWLHWLAS